MTSQETRCVLAFSISVLGIHWLLHCLFRIYASKNRLLSCSMPFSNLQPFLQFKLNCDCWVEAKCRALAHQAAPNLHVSTWTLPMSVASCGPNSGNGLVISREGTSHKYEHALQIVAPWTATENVALTVALLDASLWLGTFNPAKVQDNYLSDSLLVIHIHGFMVRKSFPHIYSHFFAFARL